MKRRIGCTLCHIMKSVGPETLPRQAAQTSAYFVLAVGLSVGWREMYSSLCPTHNDELGQLLDKPVTLPS